MSIVTLFVVLILIGVVTWAVTTYIPMDAGIRNIIRVVAVVVALFYVLNAFGVIGHLQSVRVPQVH